MGTLHLVSHTHWDREWYLPFQQFRLRLVQLVDDLLDLLESEPNYCHFMLDGQTIALEDYLQIRPEREADLRQNIQQGRILIGPWFILPDEFLVSPEAHIRNLLEGERVARRFGPKMMVGYLPDTFGHISQMPQILRGFGIDTAAVWRGVPDMPCEIAWQGPDGSRVLVANMRDSYSNAASILNGGSGLDFAKEACHRRDMLAPYAAVPHILLMHGTDHMPAQPKTSAAVFEAEGKLDGDRLIHSTLPAYLDAVRAVIDMEDLPLITGELRDARRQQLLPGVLSTRGWIKQRNHTCETLLEKWAEPFSTLADLFPGELAGAKRLQQPSVVLREAWRLLMQCHPHDSICGCSVDAVHEEMRPRFDQVEQIGEEITRQSLAALAGAVDTRPPADCDAASAVIVFNPGSAATTCLVSAELHGLPESEHFELVDEQGNLVPHQSQGLSSREVLNVVLDRKAFRDIFRSVDNGILAGMRVRKMTVERDGDNAFIAAIVRENSEANLAAWERGREAIEALLADPQVTHFHARACTEASAEVLFAAPDVPALGLRTFWVRGKPAEASAPVQLSGFARALVPFVSKVAAAPAGQRMIARLRKDPAKKPPYRIENEFYCVEARPDGTLDILDKAAGNWYRGMNRFVDGGDRGDEYNYSPPEKDRLKTARLKSVRMNKDVVNSSLELSLEMIVPESLSPDRKTRAFRMTTLHLTSQVTLTAGIPRIEVQTTIDNRARDHRLRVHFPAPFEVNSADYDGHFVVERRPLGVPAYDDNWAEHPRPEAPQRAFTAISAGDEALLVANHGLREVEVLPGEAGTSEIALTLLRCVGWLSRDDYPERLGHAGPGSATPGAQMPGVWTFDYAILPHSSEHHKTAVEQAYAYQSSIRAVSAACHSGRLNSRVSFIELDPADFVLSAVKSAEDGSGWLVRGYNQSAGVIAVTIKPLIPYQAAWRANLAEERQAALESGADGSITLRVKGHEIVTVRFS